MGLYTLLKKLSYFIDERRRERFLDELVKRGLRLGKDVFIAADIMVDPSHCYLISIGDHCGFAPDVKLIAHDGSTKRMELGFSRVGRIQIGEYCYFGHSAIILPGVKIGPNAIVGAGAVVAKDVPPNSVAVGNPARVICSLDEYLNRMKELSKTQKIFGEDYYWDKLNDTKRRELLEALENSMGFMV